MRVVCVAPWCGSGGPEALHQLCHIANELGHEAAIFYSDAPHDESSTFFGDAYPLARRTLTIDDSPETILIVPETFRLDEFPCCRFPTSMKVVWWLSLDLGLPNLAHFLAITPRPYFACQSAYAMDVVGSLVDTSLMLTDFVRCMEFPLVPKNDIVVYHLRKDATTPAICSRRNIRCVPIHNTTAEESQRLMRGAKVYCDLGSHPGRDRMPREAAMQGCVVITGTRGSAGNSLDVPIESKSGVADEILRMIDHGLCNYNEAYASQAKYRSWISGERDRFKDEISSMFERISAK